MILDKLRKTVELKRLTEELSFTSVTGYPASYSHNGLSSQGSAGRPCRLPNLEDYEIIGFKEILVKESKIGKNHELGD